MAKSTKPRTCQLGDLKPGQRFDSYDLARTYLVTNWPDDPEGYVHVVNLETGVVTALSTSVRLTKSHIGGFREVK